MGTSMRLDSTYTYPWNMTLVQFRDMNLIEKLGAQMRNKGSSFNLTCPVLDINPKNPIIGFRSLKTSIKLAI
jgi:hypothetical protein